MPSSSDLSILTVLSILQLTIPFLTGVALSAKYFGQHRVPAILALTASVLMLMETAYGALSPVLSFSGLASITGVLINNSVHGVFDTLIILLLMSAVFVERGPSRITPATNTDRSPTVPQKTAHRGALVLTLGLVALLLPPLGMLAWALGARDLKAMRQGRMDASGRDGTLIGMILGVIVSLVFVLALIVVAVLLVGVSSSTMLIVPVALRSLVILVAGITLGLLLLRRSRKAAAFLFTASGLVLLPIAYGFITTLWIGSHGLIPRLALINGITLAVSTLALFLVLTGAAFSGRRSPASNYSQDTPPKPAHHHGSLVLVLGLVSLLAIQPLGIVPWILGVQDLRAMREGRMNPEGRTATLVGTALGIIAVVLFLAALTALAFTVTYFVEHYRPFH